ncbi:nucleotidyltransferase [Paenibacillus tarimensis]
MRSVGIIVEYNPFHNGHLYHLQQSVKITQADAVVAVMSGHFLQRGEPALLDKWMRTEMALLGGCDLVIELPVAYATQAAEWFAFGAVSLLDATGVVDALCFGSESGELESLLTIAKTLASEPEQFQLLLREALKTGLSYPNAYSAAVKRYMSEQGLHNAADYPLAKPNNTLGLHYLLALERIHSRIEPYTIVREKAGYNQTDITDRQIASATAIRHKLMSDHSLAQIAPFVPQSTLHIMEKAWEAGQGPVSWELFFPKLLHQLASHSASGLSRYHEISEGLEHRLLQALGRLDRPDFESLLGALKTKRYTRTKLQRSLLAVLLGHLKAELHSDRLQTGIDYIRVLGFTEKGRQLLKRMKQSAKLPVLLSAARPPKQLRFLELDIRATSVYSLAKPDALPRDMFRDYFERPVMI